MGHQGISVAIQGNLWTFLKGNPCRVFAAPVDVFFPRVAEQDEDDVDTVVQPDLVVVCDADKLRHQGIWGPPEFTLEIAELWTQIPAKE